MTSPEVPHLTQITLTDRERWLLSQLMAVSTSFLANIFGGVPFDAEDQRIAAKLRTYAGEIEALTIKLNLDRLQ